MLNIKVPGSTHTEVVDKQDLYDILDIAYAVITKTPLRELTVERYNYLMGIIEIVTENEDLS